MRKSLLIGLLCCLMSNFLTAQITGIKGRVVEMYTGMGVSGVQVKIADSPILTETDKDGYYELSAEHFPLGEQHLTLKKEGYINKNFPIIINAGKWLSMPDIFLETDVTLNSSHWAVITLSEEELDEEQGTVDNISGLLHASRDVLLNAAAFDFSAAFFRPRGLDSEYGKVYINGLEMNKLFSGRPQWSNWGGLNDAQRNQVFSKGQSPSEVGFGGIAGTSYIQMRASEYSPGARISYAFSNKTYTGRGMASYHSGLLKNGWAFSVLASRRFADEGLIDGTVYGANGFFAAVEKKISSRHSLQLMGMYTPNRRGRSAPLTQEAFDIKGNRYNPYWGLQGDEIRNSRMRKIEEPILMLNYFGELSDKSRLQINLGYEFGKTSNSRLGFDNVPSPDPLYYKYMPSYHLANSNGPDYENAYHSLIKLQNDGQIDWYSLYETNIAYGGTSRYYLYDDQNNDRMLKANILISSKLNDNISFQGGANFRQLESDNFAVMTDLLGGNGYLDMDTFSTGEQSQPDLQHPNRIVGVGDKIKYHYLLTAGVYDAFIQPQFNFSKTDFYLAATASQTSYQRNGQFQNGNFPNNSLGKSETANFTNFGVKGGLTYHLTGRHLIDINAAYLTKPPTIRNSFSNVRQNNNLVAGLESEKILNADLSYYYRSPAVMFRLSGAYTTVQNATEISFYYADGISGISETNDNFFIQEVMTGIAKRYLTAEAGVEIRLTSTTKLKGAASVGDYFYSENAQLYLTSDDFAESQHMGDAHIKNYHLPGGAQRAYQLGFEYRDPDFWWVGVSANLMSNGYIKISPLLRTDNFYKDSDGLPFNDYDENVARELLKQERVDDIFLVNVIGGKSWRLKNYSFGIFASVNNLLNEKYKTGGYEQGRNANYRNLLEDKSRDKPIFGPKYWFGYDTSYFLNVYIRY